MQARNQFRTISMTKSKETIQENRRKILADWISENGGASAVCNDRGLSKSVASHISQILHGAGIGNLAARNMELKLGMQSMFLDGKQVYTDIIKSSANCNWINDRLPSTTTNSILIPQYRDEVDRVKDFEFISKAGTNSMAPVDHGEIAAIYVSSSWLNTYANDYSIERNLRVVTGLDDSMHPVFKSGDPIIIDIGASKYTHDSIYFIRYNGFNLVRNLQKINNGLLCAFSENPMYEACLIHAFSEFEILGIVLNRLSVD